MRLGVLALLGAASVLLAPGVTAGEFVSTITCETCPPAPIDEAARKFHAFPGGVQVETRMVDGERRVFRTDNLLGGSPVTTVTSADLLFGAPEDDSRALSAEGPEIINAQDAPMKGEMIPTPAPGVDREAMTAALQPADEPFDPAALDLRLE